ncbi:MAG: hypothetical protein RKE49_15350 [Oceanicaulis sp.]
MLRYTLMLAGALAATPAAASAQSPSAEAGPVDALLNCQTIEAEPARLACQDAALADFEAALTSGRIAVVEREVVRAVERDSFGLALPRVGALGALFARGDDADAELQTPTEETLEDGAVVEYARGGGVAEIRGLPVANVEEDPFDRLIVTLENGQVWVQTDSTRLPSVRPRHYDEGLTARIRTRMFGAHIMELSHTRRSFSVERRN